MKPMTGFCSQPSFSKLLAAIRLSPASKQPKPSQPLVRRIFLNTGRELSGVSNQLGLLHHGEISFARCFKIGWWAIARRGSCWSR